MANLKFFKSSVAPSTAEVGTVWFDSANKVLKVKTDASTWETYDGGRNVTDATLTNNVLTINKADGTKVTLDFSDVASASATMKAFGDLNTLISEAKTQADKGVADAATAKTAADEAKAAADEKIASVSGSGAVEVNTTDHAATVSLKINNSDNNVTLSQTADGLSASVTIPDAEVKGVDDDHILSLTGSKLVTATLSVDYDTSTSEAFAGKKTIQLKGKEGYILSEIDASDFIKDGMIDSVAFDEATKKLTITFNTDAGKDAIEVDLKSLVDTYKAGDGLALAADGTFSVKNEIARVGTDTDTADTDSVKGAKKYADAAVQAAKETIDAYKVNGYSLSSSPIVLGGTDILLAGTSSYADKTLTVVVEDLYKRVEAAASGGVQTIDSVFGNITLKKGSKTDGDINLSISEEKELSASIVGLGSAAFTDSGAYDTNGAAAAVLGTSADDSTAKTVYGAIALASEKATPAQVDSKIEAAAANYATAAQGAKADSALQSVSASGDKYVTASFAAKADGAQTLTVASVTHTVSDASETADGLATASDVKSYVDNHVSSTIAWETFE